MILNSVCVFLCSFERILWWHIILTNKQAMTRFKLRCTKHFSFSQFFYEGASQRFEAKLNLYPVVSYALLSPSSYPLWTSLHWLSRAVGVSLESALNLVSIMGPCWAHATHFAVLGVKIICCIFQMIELMFRVFTAVLMMMIAFITIKSSLIPLIEGLCAQI